MTTLPRYLRPYALAALCLSGTWPIAANATIVIGGDQAFRNAVLGCFERYQAAGDPAASIVNQLKQPSPDSHTHTIQPETRPGVPNTEMAANNSDAQMHGSQPGPGSDTTIRWNPNNVSDLQPHVPRDPCASLIHELQHAADDDKGLWDPRNYGTADGIPMTEVHACETENKYRDGQKPKLPQRTSYNVERPPGSGNFVPVPLPPWAIAPFPPR